MIWLTFCIAHCYKYPPPSPPFPPSHSSPAPLPASPAAAPCPKCRAVSPQLDPWTRLCPRRPRLLPRPQPQKRSSHARTSARIPSADAPSAGSSTRCASPVAIGAPSPTANHASAPRPAISERTQARSRSPARFPAARSGSRAPTSSRGTHESIMPVTTTPRPRRRPARIGATTPSTTKTTSGPRAQQRP